MIEVILETYTADQTNSAIINTLTDQQRQLVKQFVYRVDQDWITNRKLLTIRAQDISTLQYTEMLFLFPNASTIGPAVNNA